MVTSLDRSPKFQTWVTANWKSRKVYKPKACINFLSTATKSGHCANRELSTFVPFPYPQRWQVLASAAEVLNASMLKLHASRLDSSCMAVVILHWQFDIVMVIPKPMDSRSFTITATEQQQNPRPLQILFTVGAYWPFRSFTLSKYEPRS